MDLEAAIREEFRFLASRFDEHTRRIWAATEASVQGYGGISLVARATDISRRAILVGLREIKGGNILPEGRVRRPGGGRKSGVSWRLEPYHSGASAMTTCDTHL